MTLGSVNVEGGFAEVAQDTNAITARLQGRRVTLAQVYAAASEIEAAHARAGYVLARVSVPPQQLRDGAALRIVVTDGFIEAVDVSGVPERARGALTSRVHALEGKRHVTLAEIEQALLIANDIPGLTLTSTLKRGDQPGGTKVVLEGKTKLVSGSLAADNSLASSLGRWGVTAQVALNNALGLGEQVYGFAAADTDASHWFDDQAAERVLGAGALFPLGTGRLVLNPEYTYSRTAPDAVGAAPASIGDLNRTALRATYTLSRTRARSVILSGGVEQISETNALRGLPIDISHDRYVAARAGLSVAGFTASGGNYGLALQLSQGLGDFAGISKADALASGVPYSRQGADNSFTKLTAQAHGAWHFAAGLDLSVTAKGQTTFSDPVLRAEQFALEGSDGLSAYSGGETAVDEGAVGRVELGGRFDLGKGRGSALVIPYVFAAVGSGRIVQPTVLEPGSLTAKSFGVGARVNLRNWNLTVEYARGASSYAPLDGRDRLNVSTAFRF